MDLALAQRCAAKLVEWLKPFCDRIEVAGSVRRGCRTCNDLDLVVIPRIEEQRDMFGEVVARRNATWLEIDRRITAEKWTVRCAGAEIVSWVAKGIQVDLFWATPENWGTLLMCRTGSKEHNIWLCNWAIARGGKWHPNAGLYLNHKVYRVTEEEIYQALGLNPIEPSRREAHLLPSAGLIRATQRTLEK
jgi:DNA polymerase/3'-5' exonuclease PolX